MKALDTKKTKSPINRIAFIGNYLPRQCGIATFTTDLCESIDLQFVNTTCIAVPINDISTGYSYPDKVRFEIAEKDIKSYLRAADFLNLNNVDLVSLQFEYGIFGGKSGSYILTLLRELRMPIVTTLHTILKEPNADQKYVMEEISALSDRLVIMSLRGREYLTTVYNIPADKIDLIPHGIPDVPFVDPSFNKDLFGVEGKIVLLSFGLLAASKGIENVISALPQIIARYSEVVYIVVGATHPNVIKHEGETYRISLQWLAQKKGVEGNVIFYNRFVSQKELIEFISAADIYITPYLNEVQITSGTLAYTLGAGKAIVSTPYWYALELLSEERGILVPFHDSKEMADQIIKLLDNEAERHAMRKRAYMFGREMIWSKVAQRYMESFERARIERRNFVHPGLITRRGGNYLIELPPLKLDHIELMTDSTGIFQHSLFTVPDYSHGYTTDDNARALLVTALLHEYGNVELEKLASRYLAFLTFAYNPEKGRFRNFMDYQRNWLEEQGSDDSHGRALCALGTVLNRSSTMLQHGMASWLFEQTLPAILSTSSPRAWAFALIGINEYSQKYEGDTRAVNIRNILGERLLNLYQNNKVSNWLWFEKELSYCNAVIPHALLLCGSSIPNTEMIEVGLASLSWLANLQKSSKGHFVPIGSNGFYYKGGERARFDQQPVEAQTMVSASLEAYKITDDMNWNNEARIAFEWFLGRNDLNLSLYDHKTGGCRDGLHPDRANQNQGSESTLAFFQSLLELRLIEQSHLSIKELLK